MALTLDPVKVDTELAENYLKAYNNFDAWPPHGMFWVIKKYPDDREEYDVELASTIVNKHFTGQYVARKLVEKLKEHESTFYQLEYLIKKTDKSDFQNYFHLMCQHLQCDDDSFNFGYVDRINILMNEKTPLHALGCLATAKSSLVTVNIVATQKVAPICHLFTELCAQVGWPVNLIFVENVNDCFCLYDGSEINICEENIGYECIGVVTESADIDSALDVFINSSVTAPWRLQWIYVQESVYDDVKKALGARCNQRRPNEFSAGGKLLVCDALSNNAGEVPVEAYRTTKELCSLLRQPDEDPAPALSLWAADAQTAHEVALAAPATLIWINDYASFHGPPSSSLPIYDQMYTSCVSYYSDEAYLSYYRKIWMKWNKLTKNERVDAIMNVLQKLTLAPEGYDSVIDLQNEILNARDESFVSVNDGKICFSVERAPLFEDLIHLREDSKKPLADSILAAVRGLAVTYFGKSIFNTEIKNVLQSLEKAGVPVKDTVDTIPLKGLEKTIITKKIKVIRSNFGTIFAN